MKTEDMAYGIPMSEDQVALQASYLTAFATANPGAKKPSVCVSEHGWWYVDGTPYRKAKLLQMREVLLGRIAAGDK